MVESEGLTSLGECGGREDTGAPHDRQHSVREDPLAGTHYRLIRYVGRGSMGEIAEAEHVALRRPVIVKFIARSYASLPGFLDRFRLEARVLAALAPRSIHIVAVLDYGETQGGQPFLILERLVGHTLAEELRSRRVLPPAEAVALACDLLEVLGCAHEAGIVHRDVKPANIFLSGPEKGARTLKLLDFGIAKVLPGASGEGLLAPLTVPTEEGETLGTPRFLAPEQARGTAVDPRTDLYSVGAVLFAMLTGHDPFAHIKGVAAVLRAQAMDSPPAPSSVAGQPIPEALDQAVLKALAKRPEDRFASADQFATALMTALIQRPTSRWAETERMDVTSFRGMAPRAVAPRAAEGPLAAASVPEMTEPMDVTVFRGLLRGHCLAAASTGASAVLPVSAAMVSPWPSAHGPPLEREQPTERHLRASPRVPRTALTAWSLAVLVCAFLLLAVVLLAPQR